MKYPTILVKYSPGAVARALSASTRRSPPPKLAPYYITLLLLMVMSGASSQATANACPAALWPYEVQGPGQASPLEGQVVEVRGTVTYTDYSDGGLRGFFIQGPTDHDRRTSEALFVYAPGHRPSRGTEVIVHGEVKEFHGLTELTNVRSVLSCGQSTLPEPVVLGTPDEPMENMRVQLPATRIIDNYRLFDVGELVISDGEQRWTLENGRNQRRLDAIPWGLVQDPTLVANGRTLAPLTGVLTWRWNQWVILPDNPPAVTSQRSWAIASPRAGDLRVTTFNVENLFNGDQGRFAQSRGAQNATDWQRQKRKVTQAILALDTDLFLLQEIQHDQGTATPVLDELVAKLNQLDDRRWTALAPPVRSDDDAITNAFLFDADRVAVSGDLQRIETVPRPALVQGFTRQDTEVTFHVINVHLKSRGRNCDDICAEDREQAVDQIMDWWEDQSQREDPWIFGGDFNTLTEESLWTRLSERDWHRGDFDGPTYWFRGSPQQIDHFWYRELDAAPRVQVQPGHAEMPPMPYQHPLYDPASPWGASDHNPVIMDW